MKINYDFRLDEPDPEAEAERARRKAIRDEYLCDEWDDRRHEREIHMEDDYED